ncbi:MAG: ATP-binding protein [Anaerolineae bacterium]|nr:ATP-binding protein [Anaerolineae bacterium]
MRIAVASGKGGTGKTLVATSLALVASERGRTTLLDCDVEAPNAALFLKPELNRKVAAISLIPEVDAGLCTLCGKCGQVCQYHAIAVLPKKVLVFREMCHGCGSCSVNCPENAIREIPFSIGVLEFGHAGAMAFGQGTLRVGEAMATPVIRQLKKQAAKLAVRDGDTVILDSPPGTACPVIETLRGADFALLVTEPTPFGLHDLKLAAEVARDVLRIPTAVVINKDGVGDQGVESFCREAGIPVLVRIPLDRRIAEAYSEGQPLIHALPEYRPAFEELLARIRETVQGRAA